MWSACFSRVGQVIKAFLQLVDGERFGTGIVCQRGIGGSGYGIGTAGVYTAERILAASRLGSHALPLLHCFIHRLPFFLMFVHWRDVLPLLSVAGKLLRREHHGGRDIEHGGVRDQVGFVDAEVRALGILEHIDILRDAVGLFVILPRVKLEDEGVDGVRAEAQALEVIDQILVVHLGVVCAGNF